MEDTTAATGGFAPVEGGVPDSGVPDSGVPDSGVPVSVVVVTHESAATIDSCLDSIREHPPGVAYEVIVVDNASSDETVRIVWSGHPDVRVIRRARRHGFASNCNAGAHACRGRALVFLNPDTRVMPGALERLVQFLDQHPTVAVVGPRLVYPDGTQQPSARRFPTVSATLVRRTPVRWVLQDSRVERRHLMVDETPTLTLAPHTVDWVLGAAIAIRADVYKELGGMDDGYRLYCEDIDLCRRAWTAGFSVALLPSAVVEHDLAETTRKRFLTWATVWHVRAMARFARLHGLTPPQMAALARVDGAGAMEGPAPVNGSASVDLDAAATADLLPASQT